MLAWREHRGPAPFGLGETPSFFDYDGSWWVQQSVGAGSVRVLRYGMGSAATDLAAFNASVAAGDAYLAAGEFGSAVTAYQAAGNAGVTVVGPEIDVQTNGLSKAVTQQAWAINGNLAAVSGSDSSAAQSAQGFARQMANLYNQAMGLSALNSGAAPSAALTAAAQALATRINAGCTQASTPECVTFQTQYNAEGSVLLTVDGKYGPETQAAVTRVLGSAPASCFGTASTSTGTLTTPTLTITGSPAKNWKPWIIGGAAVAGAGIVGYAYWKKHKKGVRR